MFCPRCQHDLTGIVPVETGVPYTCSECGRPFDPEDPRSYAPRQRSRLEVLLLRRIAPVTMLVLLVFTLLWYAWIPRPLAMFGRWGPSPESVRFPERSTLWVWRDTLYGPESIRTGNSVSEAWVWNGRVRSVRSFALSGGKADTATPAWEVLWNPAGPDTPDGQWTMRVLRPIPLSFDLLEGFRATRERILGIVVGEHDSSITVEPFEVTGSEAEILSAYIRATRVSVRPIRSERDQEWFWIFDADLDRLIRVDEAELQRRGIEPLDRTGLMDFQLENRP